MSDDQGALNRLAGITDWRQFVGMQEAANRVAGTTGLGTQEALNRAIGITDWRLFKDEYTAIRELIAGGATAPGGGGGSGAFVEDAFATDGLLAGMTAPTGQTWQTVWGNSLTVAGGKATGPATGTGAHVATAVPLGASADHETITVSADVGGGSGVGTFGIYLGPGTAGSGVALMCQSNFYEGSNAFHLLTISTTGAQQVITNSTPAGLASTAAGVNNLSLSIAPATGIITATVDGTSFHVGTTGNRPAPSGGDWLAGVITFANYYAGHAADNFKVEVA